MKSEAGRRIEEAVGRPKNEVRFPVNEDDHGPSIDGGGVRIRARTAKNRKVVDDEATIPLHDTCPATDGKTNRAIGELGTNIGLGR